ncbi:hypothetical protein AWC38_SpisGene22957 [Stylophora pistillata]|uniref:Uncharacterized protein n=1 Tax=Stylophora pistillata TaxID=50429 RepID=A0A2B4R3U3_STYPI|nr:hypothetical protein AWC38_SpisGene22957 [Stylophora pistillata]
MSGVQPFHFEPSYDPGEEPVGSDEEMKAEAPMEYSSKIGNAEWCKSLRRTWRLALVHGVLGQKNRRVIPTCVVKAIRNTFPDASDQSSGFKLAEIDLN